MSNIIWERIYTDGSTSRNGSKHAKGGIGVFFRDNDPRNLSELFTIQPITNIRCELFACIRGIEIFCISYLQYLKNEKQNSSINVSNANANAKHGLKICTDSEFVINVMTKWINKWRTNKWKTSDKKDVKNRDLIIRLDELITQCKQYFPIVFQHVRAHRTGSAIPKYGTQEYADWYGNDQADKLANMTWRIPKI
jgi:ribonuclease HI